MKAYKDPETLESVYNEQGSLSKTAEYFGVSKKLILTHMKRFGIERKPNTNNVPTEVNISELERLLDKGVKAREIAEYFGISSTTLQRICKRHNLVLDRYHNRRIYKQSGYILIYEPDHPRANGKGYVPEHVLVVEKELGRYLPDGEVVHHINGKKNDNRVENLQVMDKVEHYKLHSQRAKKPVDLQEVLDLQEAGYTLTEICKKWEVSTSGMVKKLKKAGVYKPFLNGGQRKALGLD